MARSTAYGNRLVDFDGFIDNIMDWVGDVRKETEEIATRKVMEIFTDLVKMSPQFSGNFVANYKIGVRRYSSRLANVRGKDYREVLGQLSPSVGSANSSSVSSSRGFKATPKSMGHPTAVSFAVTNAQKSIKRFRLGDSLFIYNETPFDGLDRSGFTSTFTGKSVEDYFRYLNRTGEVTKQIRPVNLVSGEVVLIEYVMSKYL